MLIYKSKKLLLISLTILGILCIATAVIVVSRGQKNNKAVNEEITTQSDAIAPCSVRERDSILSEAARIFLTANKLDENATNESRSERALQIIELEDRIKKEQGYMDDANCQHILAMIYIDRSDAVNTKITVEKLKEIISSNNPDSYILDENANFYSIEEMESIIEVIEYNNELNLENNPQLKESGLNE